jgi:DNA polymerase bacteriophage-type
MTEPTKPLVYIDFESRAGLEAADLGRVGSYRYADHADALVAAYAIGDGPVRVVATGQPLSWVDLPELHGIFDAAVFVAWNAGFDRNIWNYSLLDSPFLAAEKTRDAMAVGLANNLPPDLQRASTATYGPGKQKDGKRLIAKFCAATSPLPDLADPDWQKFLTYAAIDVQQLRRLWRIMRPLPDEEWAVYVANMKICDRGIPIDLTFAEKAAALAAVDTSRTNARLLALTNGEIHSIHQHAALARWAYDRLSSSEARQILAVMLPDVDKADELPVAEEDDTSEDTAEHGEVVLSLQRPNVVQLRGWLAANGNPDPVLDEVLALREYGAGASPKKFKSMLEQHVNGRLFGQIVFNGAGMTGRFAGKGSQPQNMTRSVLGTDPGDDYGTFEAPTVDMIADGCSWDELAVHGLGEPVAKKLALVVRPAVMAHGRRTLIKADYSQVEARMLPFLSGGTAATMPILAAFQRSDVDPDAPDLYRVTASMMLGKPVEDISKAERQVGKVSILACGYGGGWRALISMATSYGMYLSQDEAQRIVDLWRDANPWAPQLWGKHNRELSYGLYGAAMRAVMHPRTPQRAGRVMFTFNPDYLGGTLLMRLPSGRLLTYPWCKVRDYEIKDKRTKTVVDLRRGLTFQRPNGISALYGGRLAENATQAAAADLLRDSLVAIDGQLEAVLHAHDEIVIECDPEDVERHAAMLKSVMERPRAWTRGLPLAVETTERFYYSATKERPRVALQFQPLLSKKETVQHAHQGSA